MASTAVSMSTSSSPAPKSLNALLDLPAQMELSQMELIYRAEGNANLVLALPQFKKVLRLPKIISSSRQSETGSDEESESEQSRQQAEPEAEQRQRGQANVSVKTKASSEKAGDLTMPDFMAYIEIIRRLLGNEFVCEADIVAIPKESDRFWINEHIRANRPTARLDKEFAGPFGLLLPDATQLPATLDALLSNLQAEGSTASTMGDTYAIEIKPKQGWRLLPSDVSDLFDLMPGATTDGGGEEQPDSLAPPAKLRKQDCRCRYCSMQLLKLSRRKITRLGAYCPMELFSGAPGRMLDALDALFACPQNNLRVFQNGNLIYGDHANSISCEELQTRVFQGEMMALIKHLLVACLLREYASHVADDESDLDEEEDKDEDVGDAGAGESKQFGAETKAQAAEIGAANVAARREKEGEAGDFVKAVAGQPQPSSAAAEEKHSKCSTITTTTTTEITTIEQSTCGRESTNVGRTKKATQTETKAETEALATQAQINKAEIFRLPKNCVLKKILHLQLLAKRHLPYMGEAGFANRTTASYQALHSLLAKSTRTTSSAKLLAPEEAYMLGATALDCSIMLTFREIKDVQNSAHCLQPWHVFLPDYQRHFLSKISVLDLDPKPDSHFHKFVKQTLEIEKCYREHSIN